MAKLALLISLIALVMAFLAFKEAGGSKNLIRRAEESLRRETADALSQVERMLRPPEGQKAPAPPDAPKAPPAKPKP